MGMFDYVNTPEIKCPNCGEIVTGFQSKDGPCYLKTVEFWTLDNFYSSCDSCNAWIQYNRIIDRDICDLDKFEVSGGVQSWLSS